MIFYTFSLLIINMPVIRVTASVKSELEKMKKEEEYQSFDMVIRELIHEREDRRMPESSELSEKAREEIKRLAMEYSGLLGDVDSLPEPVKSVVWFIRRIAEGGEDK
jgi:predicted CopG family antitoxin